jgi:uncharacterized OB-fold protein
MPESPAALTAPHVLEYPYTRSTGDVIGRFFAGLRERRIQGIRAADGASRSRILVPPQEYDPATGAALTEWVDVADAGAVTSWTWIEHPRPKHPLQRPFAFALIRLDGADTSMLHVVDTAGDPAIMRTGLRVRASWRAETTGDITDIESFEPIP